MTVNETAWRKATYALWAFALLCLLVMFPSYGTTWDEEVQRIYGDHILTWFSTGFRDEQALNFKNLYLYGGLFDVPVQFLTRYSPFDVYTTRHLFTALLAWVALVFVSRSAALVSGVRAGFFAAVALLCTPVFVGHAFFNPKDIPFATAFTVAMFFTLRLLKLHDRAPASDVLKAGLAVGCGLGVRAGGIFLLAIVGGLLALRALPDIPALKWAGVTRQFKVFRRIAFITWVLMLVFWPWGLQHPILRPLQAMYEASHFPWNQLINYNGQLILSADAPRTYYPVWFSHTLPEGLLLCLALVLPWLVMRLRGKDVTAQQSGRWLALGVFAFAALPLVLAIGVHPPVYDGVRHVMFVFPAFAVLAGCALEWVQSWKLRPARLALTGVVALSVAVTVVDYVQLHPYQHVYFNRLIAGGLEKGGAKLETDYWGSCVREAVEWIVDNQTVPPGQVAIIENSATGFITTYALEHSKNPNAKNFRQEVPGEQANYWVYTTRQNRHLRSEPLLHVVKRQGVGLCYVFETKKL